MDKQLVEQGAGRDPPPGQTRPQLPRRDTIALGS